MFVAAFLAAMSTSLAVPSVAAELEPDAPCQARSWSMSPEGGLVITGCFDGRIRLTDAGTGKVVMSLPAGVGSVVATALSADGRRLAALVRPRDSAFRLLQMWDLSSRERLFQVQSNANGGSLAISPTGDRVLHFPQAGEDFETVLWNGNDGARLKGLEGTVDDTTPSAISSDGRLAFTTATDGVRVYDAQSGELLWKKPGYHAGGAFSPDGRRLLLWSYDAKVVYALTGFELASAKRDDPLGAFGRGAFSQDGMRIVLGHPQGVSYWSHDLRKIWALPTRAAVTWLSTTPEGVLVATLDARLTKYSVQGREEAHATVGVFDEDHFRITPDGRSAAVVHEGKGAVRIFALSPFREVGCFAGSPGTCGEIRAEAQYGAAAAGADPRSLMEAAAAMRPFIEESRQTTAKLGLSVLADEGDRVLLDHGLAALELGDFAAARDAFSLALRSQLATTRGRARVGLAKVLTGEGRDGEAVEVLRAGAVELARALRAERLMFHVRNGKDVLADLHDELARALLRQGRITEALDETEAGLTSYSQGYQSEPGPKVRLLSTRAAALEAARRPQEAHTLRVQASTLAAEAERRDVPLIASVLTGLAENLILQGRLREAEAYLVQALDTYSEYASLDHVATVAATARLGDLRAGNLDEPQRAVDVLRPVIRTVAAGVGAGTLGIRADGARRTKSREVFRTGVRTYWRAAEAAAAPVARPKAVTSERHLVPVEQVLMTPGGEQVLTVAANEPAMLWDVTTGRLLRVFPISSSPVAASLHPDGRRLLTGFDNRLIIWDVASGRQLVSVKAEGEGAFIDRRGRRLAWVENPSQSATFNFLDGVGAPISRVRTGLRTPAVEASPDDELLLAVDQEGQGGLWRVEDGAEVCRFDTATPLAAFGDKRAWVDSVAFTDDGQHFLASGGVLTVWDVTSCSLVARHEGDAADFPSDYQRALYGGPLVSLKAKVGEDVLDEVYFSPLAPAALALFNSGELILVDPSTGDRRHVLDPKVDRVAGVAFSADGKHVAAATGDATARVWDTRTGRLIAALGR
ncbi:MAG TPA: hypothetical protein VD929_10780 [Caulobacteraceae bacterium]|nr:hypothetical protein [Caulobacteraceae bacterium]